MLSKNILPRDIKSKLLAILTILIMISSLTVTCFNLEVYAAQTKENYSDKINKYPGYAELIQALKSKYPNWNFTILYTGLDWNEVIKNESVAYHSRNLITANKSGYWFCSTCGNKSYDNGSWKCPSETAVAYYMDPRNWLIEDYIFQFEDLSYNGTIQTVEGVKQILNGTWMSGDTISYIDTNGNTQVLNKSYAQVIMEASEKAGISPYHLAARIRQEQGINYPSSTGGGKYTGYIGYYNLLNIKASGNGSETIIRNALSHAKTKGWTDPEKSIIGGAEFLAAEYINRGQSTLYLQKFDVDSSDGSLYYHQYMQNIEAAKSEGNSVKNSYANMGLLGNSINFLIPVYENMPIDPSPIPGSQYIVTENVTVNGFDVAVRNGIGTASTIITRVNTGTNLLRIEMAANAVDGYYWDKIVLEDGTKGYIARTFINKINDITNANDVAITNTGVNLRNGPGTSGTTVIITLSKGQAVTIIETGRYNNIDGFNWSKVKLANGTQGYLVSSYVSVVTNGTDSSGNILATIKGTGVRLRKGIGTSTDIVTTLAQGETVTITQKSAGTANGYTWDKIVTSSGLEGYVANIYVTIQESNPPTQNKPSVPVVNDYVKIDNANIVCVPRATVATIKTIDSAAVITKNGTVLPDSELVGTGCIVKIGENTYTVVKKGDVNGDGEINTADTLTVKQHIKKIINIDNNYMNLAADVNNDNTINSGDSLIVKQYIKLNINIDI